MYKIILYNYTLLGFTKQHKKSGLSYYELLFSNKYQENGYVQQLTFPTTFAAKYFLINNSTFQKSYLYLAGITDETILDKIIDKGKYKIKGFDKNLLCEFVIVKANDETI